MELRVANKLSYVLQSYFAESTASHSPRSSATNVSPSFRLRPPAIRLCLTSRKSLSVASGEEGVSELSRAMNLSIGKSASSKVEHRT
jgi:hypothetical protein